MENHLTTPVVVIDVERVTLQRNLFHGGIVKKPIPVSVLIRLMKSVHIKGNSYTFKQCEKVFTCSNHLNIHEEIHIGEKS